MTNTRITDPEILERRYPVVLHRFQLRPGSGGDGLYRGGDGVVRELEFLRPVTAGILSERRALRPFGLAGGYDALPGRNLLVRRSGRVVNLGGKATVKLDAGDRMVIMTPGGGGYGKSERGSAGEEAALPWKRRRQTREEVGPEALLTAGSVHDYQSRQETA